MGVRWPCLALLNRSGSGFALPFGGPDSGVGLCDGDPERTDGLVIRQEVILAEEREDFVAGFVQDRLDDVGAEHRVLRCEPSAGHVVGDLLQSQGLTFEGQSGFLIPVHAAGERRDPGHVGQRTRGDEGVVQDERVFPSGWQVGFDEAEDSGGSGVAGKADGFDDSRGVLMGGPWSGFPSPSEGHVLLRVVLGSAGGWVGWAWMSGCLSGTVGG